MRTRLVINGMWGDALSMLERADRLHRQFARFGAAEQQAAARSADTATDAAHAARAGGPSWEPPVDIVETADAVSVQVALPGVTAESVNIALEPGAIHVSATRRFVADDRRARIHRMEIPFGRFARRIALPAGLAADALELVGRTLADGCLTLTFRKLEAA